MKDMNHTQLQDELSAYLDNELAPAMRKRVDAHLYACEECRDMLSALQQNSQKIRELEHPALSIKDAVIEKIHEQLQDELSAYLDNELAPAMRKRVKGHLLTCEECAALLAVLRENSERIKTLLHPAPPIRDAVMEKIRAQAANPRVEESSHTPWLRDFGRWTNATFIKDACLSLCDLGRWFWRSLQASKTGSTKVHPITAGATGVLTLGLILGFLYLYPTAPQYEEPFDFYFGLYTEQLTDNPLKSNVGTPLSPPPAGEPAPAETVDDTELFLDLYLGHVGQTK